jgi:monovalent cation/hydrogen antiporter
VNLELAAIIGVILVVAATAVAPRIGVASPLLLIALGLGLSMLPWVDSFVVNPEWILAGVLPPLLYSAAAGTPVMEFRRDFRLISAFSVVLVVVTAVAIGLLAVWLVPGMSLGLGIALGAIVSPTDAVATSIARKAGVSARLATVLEGESMLNDASALVLLRSAVAAVGVTISLWEVAGSFVWAVVAAVVIGWVVGKLNLLVRRWVRQVPAGVALSLVVPFVAYLPAEHVGASGLVAAVAAGLVTGYHSPERIGAEERLAESAVWHTVELLLESAVFLLVGLELPALVASLTDDGKYLIHPLALAAAVGAVALLIRTGFVAFAVWSLARRNRVVRPARKRLEQLQDQLAEGQVPTSRSSVRKPRSALRRWRASTAPTPEARLSAWHTLVSRRIADLDYLAAEQFGWRDGFVLVWAGMRGAVTIAAAQTLPVGTAHRPLIILTATAVAVGTLVVQGLTLEPLARKLGAISEESGPDPALWQELQSDLDQAAITAVRPGEGSGEVFTEARARLVESATGSDGIDWPALQGLSTPAARARFREARLAAITAQRFKLIELRALGTYPSAMLDDALAQLDAQQISIELRQQYD